MGAWEERGPPPLHEEEAPLPSERSVVGLLKGLRVLLPFLDPGNPRVEGVPRILEKVEGVEELTSLTGIST